jgi:hypothetical protein
MCSIATAFIASSLFSAYGTYRQGQAAAATQKYQARVEENNAIAARQQMEAVTAKEGIERDRLRKQYAKDRATGRVGYAASGVVLGEGSPLDWELALSDQEIQDQGLLAYQADLERHALESQARGHTAQAGMYSAAAKDSRRAGLIGAGTSLLSSFSTYRQTFG